ncbi:MAG: proliferating cell nuclear antigen (pcna) [Nitrososphaerales archaeon]
MALVAKTKGPDEWKAITSAISTLVEEATFEATSESISFRGMDPSHVALIDILWPNSAFERFECDGAIKFGVRVDELSKLIKRADKNDSVELSITEENMLVVKISDGYKKQYKMRLIESTAGSTPLPKISFNAKIAMSIGAFDKLLSDIQVVSDYISIESSAEKAIFLGRGDAGEAVITLESGSEGLEELNVKDESKATYSLEYLSSIVKAIGASSGGVICEYSSKMPLRLEFRVSNVGRIHFFLAPRVEG